MICRTVLAIVVATANFSAHAAEAAKAPDAPATTAVAAKTALKGDAAKGQQIAAGVCAACHGPDGNSMVPVNPILAGQIQDYMIKQLREFKPAGGNPPVRNSPIMNGMAMTISDDDVPNVAAWFASQTMKPSAAKDDKLVAAGQKLWRAGDMAKGIPACAGCHGAAGAGLPAQYPRLAGQYADYTEAQLKAFRAGDRANDVGNVMRMIAAKMSDNEMKAVAEYAAGLR
ncbi:MAG TPA: c-type cytochrome [Rhodocyclaceae bacterium]|nr:c-type cytochrome [Rhodocyclaceae bacterium]